MVIAVVGSRNFTNYPLVKDILDRFTVKSDILVSGGAKGADTLAERYATENGMEFVKFLDKWKKYGRQAGYLRNVKIVEMSEALVAFWDGESRGTKSSIDLAKKKGIKVYVVKNGGP